MIESITATQPNALEKSLHSIPKITTLYSVHSKSVDSVFLKDQVEQLNQLFAEDFNVTPSLGISSDLKTFCIAFAKSGDNTISLSISSSGQVQCLGLSNLKNSKIDYEALSSKMVKAYLISEGAAYDEVTDSFDVNGLTLEFVIETSNEPFQEHLRNALQSYGLDAPSMGKNNP